MTISSGSYTVGSGGDYSDWNSALLDIDNGAGLTGDLTITQISDVTDTAAINIQAGAPPLNGFKLLLTSNNPPLGDVNGGWVWNMFSSFVRMSGTGDGELEVSNFNWPDGKIFFLESRIGAFDCKLHMHDCILSSNLPGQTGRIGLTVDRGGVDFYNNMSVNHDLAAALQIMQFAFGTNAADAPIRIFNNIAFTSDTSDNNGFFFSGINKVFTDTIIANNISRIGNSGSCYVFSGTVDPSFLASFDTNAATDGTLAGTVDPIENYIPVDEFTSIIFGDPDYLKIGDTSQFAAAGVSVGNPSTQDVAGTPYGPVPPIGAYVASVVILPLDSSIILRDYQHLLPDGRAFDLTNPDKQIRQYYEGLSSEWINIKQFIDKVWLDIFPQTTRELDAWERQFNLSNANALTEQERRDRLAATWAATGGQSPRYLQDTIQAAGFDLYVHEFWELPKVYPPVVRDPNAYITADGSDPLKGYLLVNNITLTNKNLTMLAGEAIAEAGEPLAEAGQFDQFLFESVKYEIPSDPAFWPYFLYFGDSVFPNLQTLPASRRSEFETLIRKITPAQQWLGLLIDWV